ncbi:anthranilate synthase component I family protein [Microbacterium lushaniae]|uniref:Anthranilate synthase component I family protein n=2 Tax=Microbacterium lushaniae TaxID=2614639 RepID=A0A5J6L8U5_9MICO|nr:anthranilate synthase component I family protein [Microbacterium lushaniae]QEW04860.1 anthranilate synthase component I family protein [Microbacterium lushaniae]
MLAADRSHVFWLDAGPDARTGWSWVGAGDPETDTARVRSVDATQHPKMSPAGPFLGGWVGWVGYEAGAEAAGAPVRDRGDATPDEMWVRTDELIAFDHASGRVWAMSASGRAEAVVDALLAAPPATTPPAADEARATARHAPREYAALIERCRDAIREGDAYQLCLTTRFEIEIEGEFDPLAVYGRLRRAAPSHHGGLLRFGDVALVSATPERFLELAEGTVRTHPIKGTRRRGADASADAALIEDLRSDPKERAENVMIVDLMRNDLSRVCDAASVTVERLLEVETYPTVHQLVSTIAGTLEPGTTVGDVLEATFPAGSMTGAPKLSAMSILHDLEGGPRGVFAGCFGWIGSDGSGDLAMVIRSILTRPDGAYVGAGGGITWRSQAQAEVAEVALKARAPLAALGAGLPPGW